MLLVLLVFVWGKGIIIIHGDNRATSQSSTNLLINFHPNGIKWSLWRSFYCLRSKNVVGYFLFTAAMLPSCLCVASLWLFDWYWWCILLPEASVSTDLFCISNEAVTWLVSQLWFITTTPGSPSPPLVDVDSPDHQALAFLLFSTTRTSEQKKTNSRKGRRPTFNVWLNCGNISYQVGAKSNCNKKLPI